MTRTQQNFYPPKPDALQPDFDTKQKQYQSDTEPNRDSGQAHIKSSYPTQCKKNPKTTQNTVIASE